jgi:hypothetical protein
LPEQRLACGRVDGVRTCCRIGIWRRRLNLPDELPDERLRVQTYLARVRAYETTCQESFGQAREIASFDGNEKNLSDFRTRGELVKRHPGAYARLLKTAANVCHVDGTG